MQGLRSLLIAGASRAALTSGRQTWWTAALFSDQAWGFDFNSGRGFLPTLGGELVTNGTFDTDLSGWPNNNIGGTFNAGYALLTSNGTNQGQIVQTINTVPGRLYAVSSQLVGGNGALGYLKAQSGATVLVQPSSQAAGTTLTAYFTAITTTTDIYLRVGSATLEQAIGHDNVSVREVQLFSYGDELVPNGTFDTDLSGWNATNGGTGTVTWSGGAASISPDGTALSYIERAISTAPGQLYALSLMSSGTSAVTLGPTQGSSATYTMIASGMNPTTFVATTSTTWIRIGRQSVGAISIDNVSVRPVTVGPRRAATFDEVFAFTATGTTSRSYVDQFGVLRNDLAANQPRYDYSNGKHQLLLENAATNGLRNNTMQGAVVGTPGTAPTNWVVATTPSGVTRTVIGTGVFNGVDYIDINYVGTLTAAAGLNFSFEGSTQIAALSGQTWTGSLYGQVLKDTGGVVAAVGIKQQLTERDAAGALLTANNGPTDITTTWARNVATQTLANASTAFLYNRVISGTIANGATIDFTIRLGLPQLEQSSFASSVIKTTGTAVTRPIETARFSPLVEAILGRSSAGVVVRVGKLENLDPAHAGRFVGGGSGGGTFIRKSAAGSAVTAVSETGVSLATAIAGSGFGVPTGSALGFDPAGRSLVFNGGTVATDTNAQGVASAAYLARDNAGSYGPGWFDYIGGQAYRPSNTQLQTLAVAA